MGRTKKFPPLPPKEGETLAVVPMPKALTPETLESRKRELALLARESLDKRFDRTIDAIFDMPDKLENEKGTSLEPLKLKLDALKWLSDRGYGKAPQVIKLGSDEGTPTAILEKIARERTQAAVEKLEADRMRAEAITTTIEELSTQ